MTMTMIRPSLRRWTGIASIVGCVALLAFFVIRLAQGAGVAVVVPGALVALAVTLVVVFFRTTVVEYGDGQGSYGTVKIRDDQGNLHEILHLDSRSVRVTDPPTRVEAGDPIGTMGGRGPDGANDYAQHVHYQMRDPEGRIIDPEAH